MIKAKEVFLKNIVVFLMLSLAVSAAYFLLRPQISVNKSVPIFVGEEVVVHKAPKALGAIRVGKVVGSRQHAVSSKHYAVGEEKVNPLSPPKLATPLPIVPPSITFKVLPTYPPSALEKGLEGVVVLAVYIDASGQPQKVETKVSSGVVELDQSAIGALFQWRFNPASQGGKPLASWFEIPVRFEVK
ncbi:MAG: energy transducer TonB [Candidatus Margulisiibacteriota bacterium]